MREEAIPRDSEKAAPPCGLTVAPEPIDVLLQPTGVAGVGNYSIPLLLE